MFAASPAALCAQQPARRPLAIEDYYRLRTIGAVQLSRDGRWVAFTLSTRVEASNGNTAEVWLVPTDGSQPERRVSADGENAGAPGWRDDGRLVYTASGKPYVIDPVRPEVREALADTAASGRGGGGVGGRGTGGRGGRGAGPGGTPVSSPDNRWSFVVRDVPPPPRALAAQTDFERRHAERFKGIQFDWLDYQRDGAEYPLPNTADPYVSPPQEVFITGRGEQGYTGNTQLTHLGLRPTAAQWSPDSRRILFTADSLYRSELSYGRSEAWTVSVPDGQLTRLTPDRRYDYRGARYSPDGRWILTTRQFTTDHVIAQKLDHGGATDLVLLPANGGTERNLTEAWDFLPGNPQWSPDGKSIYFTGGVGGTVHLFRVPADGGAVEAMTTGQRRIGDLTMDRAMSRIAYTVNAFDGLPEIWTATIDGKGERQLTHVGDGFLREVQLGRTERQQFTSPDGTPIEGWLTLPPGYRADGPRLPLIVSNHGGPHSAIQYGFNFKNQYFAANGYAVLEVNFRSSTGYGEKFLWGTWGAWGTKDGQDVMAGVDHVLARYTLDRRRVASIGHSYGGFMTNWLITQYPERFAAAASGAGIVNWMSDYANADIARTKETEFFGKPWEEKAREVMLRQSPITYAGRARTPTLFVVGEVDRRVPFTENEQLYVALKKQGVPAKMIVYANMPHGISGHWNVVHRTLNEKAWFDQYLKPPAVP
jgi:dipeptidyl aminopeptidase/acylaminoacyl peptidase